MMIRILLVDDHPLHVEGIKLIIETEQDMKVHIETSSIQALETVKTNSFDVMLFDLQMPEMDGFELTKKVIEVDPKAKILIYSGFEVYPHLEMLMDSGSIGFLSKNATKEQLIRAIRSALDNEMVIPFPLFKEIYNRALPMIHLDNVSEKIQLNEKERAVLLQLVKGKKNKEIAQTLFVGQRSLEYCLTSLFQKLGVQTRIEAVVKAKEMGIVDF
ncbi:response regulator transcription factor [Pseudoneobacillus sp. C159]